IAGNLLFQHSMDAGDRWMINDAAGQPFYAWDVNDRVIEDGSTVREERVFHIIYDGLRRPLEQQLRINSRDWQVVERFVYGEDPPDDRARNLRGQLHQHYDPSGLITNRRFDFKGNLLEARRRLASEYRASVIDWSEGSRTTRLEVETFTQRTEYDALNRMTRLENWHLDGRTPAIYTPRYNQRGLLAGETLSVRGSATDAIAGIAYNEKGQRTRLEYGNGATTTYEYDSETFRLIRLRTTRRTDSTLLQDLQYSYDPVGNITELRDGAQQTVYFANAVVEPHCKYEYDALYRLIRAEGREHAVQNNVQRDGRAFEPVINIPFPNSPEALQRYTETYRYDSAGNIQRLRHVGGSVDRWTRRYRYAEDSNRLLATSLPGDGAGAYSARYDYDVHGSMLNLNRTPADDRLRWDYRDMIQHVNLGGGGQVWYNYDVGKQRTRKLIERNGSTVEDRLYLGGMELYRRRVGGTVVEEIESHHLFADDQRMLLVDDVLVTDNASLGTEIMFRYQCGNHLGSVALELDADAVIISYEEYHPYGTTAYQARERDVRATAKRYHYTGMERDEESGLSYHTARYYVPWLGRWGSLDPATVTHDSSQESQNQRRAIIQSSERFTESSHYSAFANNPLRYVDPTGMVIDFSRSYEGKQGRALRIAENRVLRIVGDLESITGLRLQVNPETHHLEILRDEHGSPIEAGGGSRTAREFVLAAIAHDDGISVDIADAHYLDNTPLDSGRRGTNTFGNDVELDAGEIVSGIEQLGEAAMVDPRRMGLDPRTLGWGMTFLHEARHTIVGGGLTDEWTEQDPRGATVNWVNQVRSEIPGFGFRGRYIPTVRSYNGDELRRFGEEIRAVFLSASYIAQMRREQQAEAEWWTAYSQADIAERHRMTGELMDEEMRIFLKELEEHPRARSTRTPPTDWSRILDRLRER
ncbi:MAG: RHS repeat domain-containing protein, partial [Gammaproteobacteria bacterium]